MKHKGEKIKEYTFMNKLISITLKDSTVTVTNHQTFGSGTNESGRFSCVNLIPTFRLTVVNWTKPKLGWKNVLKSIFLVKSTSVRIGSVNGLIPKFPLMSINQKKPIFEYTQLISFNCLMVNCYCYFSCHITLYLRKPNLTLPNLI